MLKSIKTTFSGLLGLLALAAGPMQAEAKNEIEVTWLGHATFEVVSPAGTRVMIDPFLLKNPNTPDTYKALDKLKPDAIVVTHAHFDHSADAKELATKSGAPVISTFEWVKELGLPEAQTWGGNVGGTFKVKTDVTVTLVPAMHSSHPGGRPLGVVLTFADGRSLYHTGDTWIFGDMALIQEIYRPTIVLLNAGGGPFTQNPKTAALAIKKYFKPKAIIPMHYGTFPPLAQRDEIESIFKKDRNAVLMKPGETKRFGQ